MGNVVQFRTTDLMYMVTDDDYLHFGFNIDKKWLWKLNYHSLSYILNLDKYSWRLLEVQHNILERISYICIH